MTAKTDLPEVPAALADVALIDGPSCAASASMSLSAWLDAVREGRAPQPVIRRQRFTRWRAADVRGWLAGLANDSTATIQHGKRASLAAQAKRRLRAVAHAEA